MTREVSETRLTHHENGMSTTNLEPPPKPRAAPQFLFIEVDPLVRATQQAPKSRVRLNRHVQLGRFPNPPKRKRAATKSSASKKTTPIDSLPYRVDNRPNAPGPEQGQCSYFNETGGCTGSSNAAPETSCPEDEQEILESLRVIRHRAMSRGPTPNISAPNVSQIDPFGTSPSALNQAMNALFHHWLDRWVGRVPSIIQKRGVETRAKKLPSALVLRRANEAQSNMIRFVLQEPIVLFAILSYAAGIRKTGSRGLPGEMKHPDLEIDPEVTAYRLEAIKRLNKTLASSSPETGIPPSVVVAIIYLCNLENLSGNTHAFSIHLAGLQKIINLRGGLQGLVPTLIPWLDDCVTMWAQGFPLLSLDTVVCRGLGDALADALEEGEWMMGDSQF